MKNRILILLHFVIPICLYAQERLHKLDQYALVFHKEVKGWQMSKDSAKIKYGPNASLYTIFNIGYGTSFDTDIKYDLNGIYNRNVFGSLSFKLKISNVFALISDIGYDKLTYRFNSDSLKRDKIALHNAHLGTGLRINFDHIKYRRGQHLGNYIDLMSFGSFSVVNRQKQVAFKDDDGQKLKTIITNLATLNRVQYGFQARIGFNMLTLYGKYYLSELIKDKVNQGFLEDDLLLPRFVAGVALAIGNG